MLRSYLVATLLLALAATAQAQDDIADVTDKAYRAANNAKFLYIEIGSEPAAPEPADGYKLLLVLPGGDGGRDFLPFIKRIYKHALNEDYLVAQLVAPKWARSEAVVWPTAKDGAAASKFTTEKFIAAVVEDVGKRHRIDRRHVFGLGWSSGGPPLYAASLQLNPVVTAIMPAMSIFYRGMFPPLKFAKDRPYYIFHSPDDEVCKFELAQRAAADLKEAGAKVKLVEYPGGHGWTSDPFANISAGVAWMEEQTAGE
jgi:predicted esterase